MCSICVVMNWKETLPSNCELQSVINFLTIENDFGAEIHRCLCAVYEEENAVNLRNVQQWMSMFQEGRTNISNAECEWRLSTTLDETV